MMQIRKAGIQDIDAIEGIYDRILSAEEAGEVTIGWVRGVYPVRETAEAALRRGDLFVGEEDGAIVGTAIFNHHQEACYAGADWQYDAPDEQVMVMHTLVIDPLRKRSGYGSQFVEFYEKYARECGCPYLRIDTQAKNQNARCFYQRYGYREAGIVLCEFNGIHGVRLLCLEKKI